MRLTTLCYVERDGCWLMLHRVKKNADENAGKWIGIGGHLEENESPEECIRREAREEAGVELSDLRLRGIITRVAAFFCVQFRPESLCRLCRKT